MSWGGINRSRRRRRRSICCLFVLDLHCVTTGGCWFCTCVRGCGCGCCDCCFWDPWLAFEDWLILVDRELSPLLFDDWLQSEVWWCRWQMWHIFLLRHCLEEWPGVKQLKHNLCAMTQSLRAWIDLYLLQSTALWLPVQNGHLKLRPWLDWEWELAPTAFTLALSSMINPQTPDGVYKHFHFPRFIWAETRQKCLSHWK